MATDAFHYAGLARVARMIVSRGVRLEGRFLTRRREGAKKVFIAEGVLQTKQSLIGIDGI
jgi:hypothetical protein